VTDGLFALARAEEQDRDRHDERHDAHDQEDRVRRGACPLQRVEGPAHQEGEPPRMPVAVRHDVAEHRPDDIIGRVHQALASRGYQRDRR